MKSTDTEEGSSGEADDSYYEPDDLDDEINSYGKITETVEDAVRLWNRRADEQEA